MAVAVGLVCDEPVWVDVIEDESELEESVVVDVLATPVVAFEVPPTFDVPPFVGPVALALAVAVVVVPQDVAVDEPEECAITSIGSLTNGCATPGTPNTIRNRNPAAWIDSRETSGGDAMATSRSPWASRGTGKTVAVASSSSVR